MLRKTQTPEINLFASITAGFQTDCTFPSVIRLFIPRYFNLTGSPLSQTSLQIYQLLDQKSSCLPSSLSQFEQAIGHGRGRRGSDGQSLVDCFQDEAAVKAPGEGAEVARQMFGRDGAMRSQEAVFDVGEHGICPAEGGMSGGGAVGAGDVALVDDAGLVGNATKPLATIADDGGSGRDAGA